jgi:hypothetical protein
MLIGRGDLTVFIERPISAVFVGLSVLLIVAQIYVWLRKPKIIASINVLDAEVPASTAPVEATVPPAKRPDTPYLRGAE